MTGSRKFRAAILGGSGYGGGEMIRRLLIHPEVELVRVGSIDFVGEPLWAAHPNLSGFTSLRFLQASPTEIAKDVDVVLLGLPHKVAARLMPELIATGVKIVDLSGDFRLRDRNSYEQYYEAKHPCPELLGRFVYGLPELNRRQIETSQWVASPGCFATTIELGLLPFAKKKWLAGNVEVTAMTGSSGSGVTPSQGTHHPTRANNIKTYKTLCHQHTPEILETLHVAGGQDVHLHFVPVSAPLSRGLFATSFVHLSADIPPEAIHQAVFDAYQDEPFVRVPERRMPEVAAVAGTHFVEVNCVVGEVHNGQRVVTVVSALDNLIKGGAGQGIQNMNLMLGLDETLSLNLPGAWP